MEHNLQIWWPLTYFCQCQNVGLLKVCTTMHRTVRFGVERMSSDWMNHTFQIWWPLTYCSRSKCGSLKMCAGEIWCRNKRIVPLWSIIVTFGHHWTIYPRPKCGSLKSVYKNAYTGEVWCRKNEQWLNEP
jgi:hypothetical protein